MKLKFLLFFAFFMSIAVYSQTDDITVTDIEKKASKDKNDKSTQGASQKSLEESVEELKKNITDKVTELEQVHKKLVELDPSQKEELYIENTTSTLDSIERMNIFKYLKINFKEDKITTIRIVTQKISQKNEMSYSKNILEFSPPDIDGSEITIKTPEYTDYSKLKDYYPQTKKRVLKVVFNNLQSAVIQMTFSIRSMEKAKENAEKKRANF